MDIGIIINTRVSAGARLHDLKETLKRAKKPEEVIIAEANLKLAIEQYHSSIMVERFCYQSLGYFSLHIPIED